MVIGNSKKSLVRVKEFLGSPDLHERTPLLKLEAVSYVVQYYNQGVMFGGTSR